MTLEEENEMLKKEIAFLRESLTALIRLANNSRPVQQFVQYPPVFIAPQPWPMQEQWPAYPQVTCT